MERTQWGYQLYQSAIDEILAEVLNIIITCLLPRLLKERAGIWKHFLKRLNGCVVDYLNERKPKVNLCMWRKIPFIIFVKWQNILTQTPCMYVPLFWNLFCEDEPACRPRILKQRNSVKSFAKLGNILFFRVCAFKVNQNRECNLLKTNLWWCSRLFLIIFTKKAFATIYCHVLIISRIDILLLLYYLSLLHLLFVNISDTFSQPSTVSNVVIKAEAGTHPVLSFAGFNQLCIVCTSPRKAP